MTLIDAKFDADLINISEVASRKTKWPRFFLPTLYTQTDRWRLQAYRRTAAAVRGISNFSTGSDKAGQGGSSDGYNAVLVVPETVICPLTIYRVNCRRSMLMKPTWRGRKHLQSTGRYGLPRAWDGAKWTAQAHNIEVAYILTSQETFRRHFSAH